MKNYINLDGQQTELTDEQVEQLKGILGMNKISLAEIPAGETFKIGQHEFVVLEQSGDTTAVILREPLGEKTAFGKNNNYDGSAVDKTCDRFGVQIAKIVGQENLVVVGNAFQHRKAQAFFRNQVRLALRLHQQRQLQQRQQRRSSVLVECLTE